MINYINIHILIF